MRILYFLPVAASGLTYAASWGFTDGSLTVSEARGAGEGRKKQSFAQDNFISAPVPLKQNEILRISITTTNGGKARRPHQAFLALSSLESGLEEVYALDIKENGKAKLDVTHAKIPAALLESKKPLQASIVVGSFGSSKPVKSPVFSINAFSAGSSSASSPSVPRYSSLPEIHHIFRADPKSPAKIITLVFTLAVLGALPALVIAWTALGANLDQLGAAFSNAGPQHSLFFGSIVGIEFAFWKYYTSWTLFQTLPVAGVLGVVALVTGSSALTEVQERRLQGKR